MLESGRCQSEGYTLHLHKEYKSKIEACGKSEGAVCSMRRYEEFSNGNGYPRGIISVIVNYMCEEVRLMVNRRHGHVERKYLGIGMHKGNKCALDTQAVALFYMLKRHETPQFDYVLAEIVL